jgi:phage host-nuclease inhibitor protein Gam
MFNISANLNPYIAIASAIIATISLVGTLIKQNAEAEKKANDARIEAANESAEKTKQMEEELASYEELIETYKETGEETDELIERKEELIKLFDLEVYGVNALTSSYEEVAEAMREARIA